MGDGWSVAVRIVPGALSVPDFDFGDGFKLCA
jgi:hypothetical protein